MLIETGSVTVPALGFGTWRLRGRDAVEGVRTALDAGYRHIDTAQMYDNEVEVGRAIAEHPVDRDEVFVTTKVERESAAPGDVLRTTSDSLTRLGLDHVDLLLLHWPAEDVAPLEATLGAFSQLRERGLTRHIGVSNFPSAMFRRACELAPVVNNQVEHHPFLAVDAIIDAAADNDAFVTAYSPIARGAVLSDPTLLDIARAHGVSPVQVTLRWHLQRGICAIPRSVSPERIRSNADVFGFSLTDDEMRRITALDRGQRLVDPSRGPDWDT